MGKPPGWLDEAHHASDAPYTRECRLCPHLSWEQAANRTDVANQPAAEDGEMFLCPVHCGPNTFVLEVRGESMAPKFCEGDFIFVDPDRSPENGNYVVARIDGSDQATLKQLAEDAGKPYLLATNPHWPNRIVAADAATHVCGVVVYKGRPF